MGFPKQVKKQIQLVPPKTLSARREQLLEYINKDGTYLPKSVLHADLDKGMLEFVKEELRTVVSGKVVPTVDILITTQNWSQLTETWNFVDLDRNVSPPFITTVRNPEVKYGSNPSLLYTIPNRKQYYYATVPTWDGQRKGLDIALGFPAFVTGIDPDTNTVVLGTEDQLLKQEMWVSKINWLKYQNIEDANVEITTKIRYKDKGAVCTISPSENGVKVVFYETVKGIAPGQSAVFYDGNDVIGGGIIQRQ